MGKIDWAMVTWDVRHRLQASAATCGAEGLTWP